MLRLDENRLIVFAQLYLLIPFLVFLISFFSWFYSIPIFLVFSYVFITNARSGSEKIILSIKKNELLIFTLLLALLAAAAFAQSWMGYCNDSVKHRAVLNDLVNNTWPVSYSGAERLVYYLGFYILPALTAKIDAALALPFVYIWTFAGLFLSIIFFHILSAQKLLLSLLFFCICSGLDILGAFQLKPFQLDLLENSLGGDLQYSAHLTALNWVPQHAISAWLGAFILFRSRDLIRDIWIIVPVAFYSVFAAAGLFMLFIILILVKNKSLKKNTASLAAFIVGLALLFSWYSSGNGASTGLKFIAADELESYLIFILCEVLILLPFAWASREDNWPAGLFPAIVLLLCLIPLVKTEVNNDWCMRASLPLLFLFFSRISSGAMVFPETKRRYLKFAALLLIFLMAANPLLQAGKGFKALYSSLTIGEHPQLKHVKGKEAVPALPQSKYYLGR